MIDVYMSPYDAAYALGKDARQNNMLCAPLADPDFDQLYKQHGATVGIGPLLRAYRRGWNSVEGRGGCAL